MHTGLCIYNCVFMDSTMVIISKQKLIMICLNIHAKCKDPGYDDSRFPSSKCEEWISIHCCKGSWWTSLHFFLNTCNLIEICWKDQLIFRIRNLMSEILRMFVVFVCFSFVLFLLFKCCFGFVTWKDSNFFHFQIWFFELACLATYEMLNEHRV